MSKIKGIAKERGISESELLATLYKKHNSQTAIARELGVAQGTVSQALLRCGLRVVARRELVVIDQSIAS